jgi:hypothetical protein
MSYQIEIHGYDNDADARKEAERLSRCKVDGVLTTVWLNARRPGYFVDHIDTRDGWNKGSTDPEDAKNAFSLVIELVAKTETGARRATEEFCAKAHVRCCSLLEDLERGVDEYDVSAGWEYGPDEEAEH